MVSFHISSNYTTNALDKTEVYENVNSKKVSKIVIGDDAYIKSTYYNVDDEAIKQEKSLLFYKNTYYPNKGILYESEASFSLVAPLNGKIISYENEVMTFEINNDVYCKFYGIVDLQYKVGDIVKQDYILGNALEQEKGKYETLFLVFKNNSDYNPTLFFNDTIDKYK